MHKQLTDTVINVGCHENKPAGHITEINYSTETN